LFQNEDEHTTFLAIDFGICEEDGVIPKLIEVQGFPSLYNYQINLFHKFKAILSRRTNAFFDEKEESRYRKSRRSCNNHQKKM
jgi:hypothetical protein